MHSESSSHQMMGFVTSSYSFFWYKKTRQLQREMCYNEPLLNWEVTVDQELYLKANQGLMTTMMMTVLLR
jgi:hypothetical protein